MRKYLREIARNRMQKAGIERFNKTAIVDGRYIPSYFSRKWRDYLI